MAHPVSYMQADGPGRLLRRNSMIESFWSTMQRELLDTRAWDDPAQLASAIFEWVETSHCVLPRDHQNVRSPARGREGSIGGNDNPYALAPYPSPQEALG
jgi:hypothetical protein